MQSLVTAPEVSFSPLSHRYTLEQFWTLPEPGDRSHYELIGGLLFMVPPPEPPHGRIDARLAASLHWHLRSNDVLGEVHHPREAIYIDENAGTYLEPDMMYVSDELRRRLRSSADIVFEYLSESTAVYNRTTKAHTYLALGVRELWLIDSGKVTIEVRHVIELKGKLAWETWRYTKGDLAESRVLSGWQVSVDDLFEGWTSRP
jgi:Uma2 family endonuclease